jgi:mycofactocin precursor
MSPTATDATLDPVIHSAVTATPADGAGDDEVLAEVLVEEISIDGMCGVY